MTATDKGKMIKTPSVAEEGNKDYRQHHHRRQVPITSSSATTTNNNMLSPYVSSKNSTSVFDLQENSHRVSLGSSKSPDVPPKLPAHNSASTHRKRAASFASPRCCLTGQLGSSSPSSPIRYVQRNISDVSMESTLLLSPGDYLDPNDNEDDDTTEESSVSSSLLNDNDVSSNSSDSPSTEEEEEEGDSEYDVDVDLSGLGLGSHNLTRNHHLNNADLVVGKSNHILLPVNHDLGISCRSAGEFEDFEVPVGNSVDTKAGFTNLRDRREGFIRGSTRKSLSIRDQLSASTRSLDSLPIRPTRRGSMGQSNNNQNASWDNNNNNPTITRRSFNSYGNSSSPMDCCEATAISDKSPSVPPRR